MSGGTTIVDRLNKLYVLEIPENTSFDTVFYGYSNDDNDIWSV